MKFEKFTFKKRYIFTNISSQDSGTKKTQNPPIRPCL